jgi:hypothetical protein
MAIQQAALAVSRSNHTMLFLRDPAGSSRWPGGPVTQARYQGQTGLYGLQRFTQGVGHQPGTAKGTPGLTGLMALIGLQVGERHLQQGLLKFMVLTAELYLTGGIDIEKLTATQAFPGSGVISPQHFLGMLAIELHASKQVVLR